jgi:hypothetical protein
MAPPAWGGGDEAFPIEMDEVPGMARHGLLRAAHGAPIAEVMQETKDGETIYKEFVHEGGGVTWIEVDADGEVVSRRTHQGY